MTFNVLMLVMFKFTVIMLFSTSKYYTFLRKPVGNSTLCNAEKNPLCSLWRRCWCCEGAPCYRSSIGGQSGSCGHLLRTTLPMTLHVWNMVRPALYIVAGLVCLPYLENPGRLGAAKTWETHSLQENRQWPTQSNSTNSWPSFFSVAFIQVLPSTVENVLFIHLRS